MRRDSAGRRVLIPPDRMASLIYSATMRIIAALLRSFARWRFQARGLATLMDLSEGEFQRLSDTLAADGWAVASRYFGVDAGIDYDCIRLKKNGRRLKCEWDRWDGWSVEGPEAVVQRLAIRAGRTARNQSRWDVGGAETAPFRS
jgi:uncharacterized protein YjiS (DUF1127 family)